MAAAAGGGEGGAGGVDDDELMVWFTFQYVRVFVAYTYFEYIVSISPVARASVARDKLNWNSAEI